MKKIIFLIILITALSIGYAQEIVYTNYRGDIKMARVFDEQFEATGYDEDATGIGSNWSKVVGSGAIVDEDVPTGGVSGAPADWDSLCLQVDTNSVVTYARNDLDSQATTLYIRVEIIINEVTDENVSGWIFLIQDTSFDGSIETFVLKQAGPIYKLRTRFDAGDLTDVVISLNTRYRLEYYYTTGAGGSAEWRIDGVQKSTDTGMSRDLKYMFLGLKGGGTTDYITFYDNFALDDADWVGAEPTKNIIPIIMHQFQQRRA